MAACPAPLASGSVRAIERASAYWAFRIVKHTARGVTLTLTLTLTLTRTLTLALTLALALAL